MLQLRQVLLLLVLCGSFALKGEREESRNLDISAGPPGKDWGDGYIPPVQPKPSAENNEEKGGKKGKKQPKPKGKKCAPPKGKNWGRRTRNLDETDEDGREYVSCKSFKKGGGACAKLLEGKVPAVPSEEAEQLVGGSITLEMHPKTDDAVEKMGRALKEAALATAGCDSSFNRQRALQANDETGLEVELNGINMDSLEEVSNLCTNTDEEYQESCTQFESILTVYFSGNATDDHISSMMNQFTGAVLDEATDGKYDEFADIYFIGATSSGVSSSASTRNNSEGGGASGANVGAIVGGVIGGLALVGAAVGGFLFYKRRQGGERVSPITAVDSQDGEGFLVLPNLFG